MDVCKMTAGQTLDDDFFSTKISVTSGSLELWYLACASATKRTARCLNFSNGAPPKSSKKTVRPRWYLVPLAWSMMEARCEKLGQAATCFMTFDPDRQDWIGLSAVDCG